MPADFIAVYRVVVPIVAPIAAASGMVLTVWPRSDSHTLAVCRAGDPRVVRHCAVDPGLLYGMVMQWEDRGVISPLSAGSSLTTVLRTA